MELGEGLSQATVYAEIYCAGSHYLRGVYLQDFCVWGRMWEVCAVSSVAERRIYRRYCLRRTQGVSARQTVVQTWDSRWNWRRQNGVLLRTGSVCCPNQANRPWRRSERERASLPPEPLLVSKRGGRRVQRARQRDEYENGGRQEC